MNRVVAAVLLCAVNAVAAEPFSLQPLKDAGILPTWVTLDDSWWAVSRKELLTYYVYDCFVDAPNGELRHVVRSPRAKRRRVFEGLVPWSAVIPSIDPNLTAEQKQVCFPDATS